MTTFLAGAARVKTTPPLGTRINGDFITHYATYIHDDLFAKALVFRSGDTTVALVMVDICVMPKEFIDGVKAAITARTGLPHTHMLIASTHTHAAGSVADVHLGSIDPAYEKMLPGRIVQAVEEALQNLRPARIAFGAVAVPEHVLCRRYAMKPGYAPLNPVTGGADGVKTNPFGAEALIDHGVAPADPALSFLAVRGTDGRWISILGNYSLHYVGDWENGTISADYFGYFSERLRERLNAGDEFVGMMSNGTSGDVNIWDFQDSERYPKGHFEKSEYIGHDLADKVIETISALVWQDEPTLEAVFQPVPCDIVKPSLKELEKAAQMIATARFETIEPDHEGLMQIYAREQLLLNEMPAIRECPAQAIRIGNAVIGGLAGEFFSETGLYLKAQAGIENYFTISMANGNAGYVPPKHEMERGGYETWRCRYSCLAPGAEEHIREQLLGMIRSLQA
ncbi:hypothetical protein SAMN04487996_113106 [Dyadobacter soli]|uniref:Neutral/alkaline non-lysosomal ceramidase, N-terminal n=1 Tax=Dyadobacter soli TaxID=659014 RepID=A0A1G7PRS2_9BACT|nr:hypothetical protein [Dyadobacter soli]SDF88997.1 hypothetical protein SAMN04487996_113106 [Dyadobacter soli]